MAAIGCQPDSSRAGTGVTSPTEPGLAPPPLDLLAEGPWPAPYAAAPLWLRAASGQDIDQARLANSEGAAGLMSAVERGGGVARTALSALSYAPDRQSAGARLCELLVGPDPGTVSLLVAALHQAVTSGPTTVETGVPSAGPRCVAALRELTQATSFSPATRDLADSTLAAFRVP
jgi:hypothetical protein